MSRHSSAGLLFAIAVSCTLWPVAVKGLTGAVKQPARTDLILADQNVNSLVTLPSPEGPSAGPDRLQRRANSEQSDAAAPGHRHLPQTRSRAASAATSEDGNDEPPQTLPRTASATNGEDGKDVCAVCFEEFKKPWHIEPTNCQHPFHHACLQKWRRKARGPEKAERCMVCQEWLSGLTVAQQKAFVLETRINTQDDSLFIQALWQARHRSQMPFIPEFYECLTHLENLFQKLKAAGTDKLGGKESSRVVEWLDRINWGFSRNSVEMKMHVRALKQAQALRQDLDYEGRQSFEQGRRSLAWMQQALRDIKSKVESLRGQLDPVLANVQRGLPPRSIANQLQLVAKDTHDWLIRHPGYLRAGVSGPDDKHVKAVLQAEESQIRRDAHEAKDHLNRDIKEVNLLYPHEGFDEPMVMQLLHEILIINRRIKHMQHRAQMTWSTLKRAPISEGRGLGNAMTLHREALVTLRTAADEVHYLLVSQLRPKTKLLHALLCRIRGGQVVTVLDCSAHSASQAQSNQQLPQHRQIFNDYESLRQIFDPRLHLMFPPDQAQTQ